ncbi:MAG: hypothetical protein KAR42_01250 [candidate division Zixibacteria bacterium]|nr:hypothetical protein [candidate division Zixibacteria bacterium]
MKKFLLLLLAWLFLSSTVFAANIVDMEVVGAGSIRDTLYTNIPYEVKISIENDELLGGIALGYKLTNPEGGVSLSYPAQVGGYGYYEAFTVNPASRMYPTASVWDLGNLIVSDTGYSLADCGLNGNLPDTIDIGGVAMMGGMDAGVMEHMMSLHFTITSSGAGEYETLCIDSACSPPGCPFFFIGGSGSTIAPIIGWDSDDLCFSVINRVPVPGDANFDGYGNLGDVVFIINYVFKNGEAPLDRACSDVNSDCEVNAADAVRLIDYIFRNGPPISCSSCL